MLDGPLGGSLQGPVQSLELGGRQLAGGSLRGDLGLPQGLVGEQVADAGDHRLVEQPGLDRRLAAADPVAELAPA